MTLGVHVNLDNAWDAGRVGMRTVEARGWGPRLRYTAPQAELERAFAELWREVKGERFVLYGSGDFHHLAAWWMKRAIEQEARSQKPEARRNMETEGHGTRHTRSVVLVTFDNHPDWDVRPPKWGCGGWVNRVLEMEGVWKASVWGCGNFELGFPSRLFRNRRAMELGRLAIHGWAQRQRPRVARMFDCMTGEDWRERFTKFARSLAGAAVYVSVDMDCLGDTDAVTNWEHGLFTAGDVAWALCELHARAHVIGGDMCGAYSVPEYSRRWQRFVGNWDHPKLQERDAAGAREANHRSLEVIWPALVGNG